MAKEDYLEAIRVTKQLDLNLLNDNEGRKKLALEFCPLILNYCQCLLELETGHSEIIKHTTDLIEKDGITDSAKIFYKRMLANLYLANEKECLKDLDRITELDPSLQKLCQKKRKELFSKLKERDKNLSKNLKKMF